MSVTLINRLESALGIRISMAKLIRGPNLSELVDGLIAEMGADQPVAEAQISAPSASEKGHWLTLVAPRSNPRVRLFCFPFAGGGSAVYRNWVPSIDDDIEIVAIEPPGRLNRIDEEPVSDIDEFVRQAMAELQDKLDRPFVFFGHCLGGLTMYETTRQLLHTTSYRPQHLFVSGARPPDKLVDQGDFEQQLLRDLMQFADYRMNLPSHAQPDDVFAAIIRRFGILATEQLLDEPELRDLMLPVIRAEFRMANNYVFRPEPPWDIPITCFHAREDPYVTREHALGWGRFTDKRLRTHMRSGAHFAVAEDLAFITSVINRECRF
jgi:surfactin synthase thioesterase subunit